MISQESRKIEKIYKKINKLANSGYKESFYDLLDDLINKGDYFYFENVMEIKYNIKIKNKTINDIRENIWLEILKQTNPSVSEKIKKIYDNNNVYQIGYDIYGQNDILGKIEEISINPNLSMYYYVNKELEKQRGTFVTYLKVTKYKYNNINESVIKIVGDVNYCMDVELLYNWIDNWIDCPIINTSEDNNLVKRYESAIQYLLLA
ncbi:MAG: hypothetical protein M0R46_10520 [Candidatus Muirbacterium halophilum]|nr:hypothetical protein [Candidatus Muirbacterium halophilum]